MNFYFTLQFKRISRYLKDGGINPILGVILLLIVFLGLSTYVFFSLSLAQYIYPGIALSLVSILGEKKRNTFLKTLLPQDQYLKIRVIENLLFVLPFILFCLLIWQLIPAIIILVLAPIFVKLNHNIVLTKAIPTPFGKKPFEYIAGFRQFFPVVIICYLLGIASYFSGNLNLNLFANIILVILPVAFFTKPEHEIFVWNYNNSSSKFLNRKINNILFNQLLLTLPLALFSAIVFSEASWGILIFVVLGLGVSTLSLLGKYAYYPNDFNIIQTLAIGACILFPPLLLVLIPTFYIKAKNKLTPILL